MQHQKQLRMTKQEIKDEFKQAEGDPHIKGRLRQIRMDRARQRMMQAVPEADVVVTNPTHFAIALSYKPEDMEAPIVVAKGQDEIARKIREVAEENDITIVENKPLAQALFKTVEIGQDVPTEHYKAVAEIISYVWRIKGRVMPAT
jgi:flagellar biosynthetic protein FlhB